MNLRTTRRRAVQSALATAATATLPASLTSARQATPVAVDDAEITAAQVQSALDRLDRLIEDGMAQTGVPGVAVAVVYGDEVVYERGFGVRELGRPEPITPETVFPVASLAKAISSTLVAAVVGDGTTTWDATVASLEPGFALSDPWVTNQVTIRDMLSHRSGLPAYGGDSLVFTFRYDREECLRRLRHYALATPFRTAWNYSNLGFSSGAYAAARATGLSWEDLADTRLFAPLGMTSSSYRFADLAPWDNQAAPHFRTLDGVWEPGSATNDDASAPAGGVSSNLRDLTRWLRLVLAGGMLDGQPIVASEALREAHRPQTVAFSPPDPAAGSPTFYGLGWFITYDDRGRQVVRHGGDFNSYATQATLLPGSGLGILVLCNGGAAAVREAIPIAFMEMVTEGEPSRDWVSEIETSFAANLATVLATSVPFPQGEPPADGDPPLSLDAYTGTYTNPRYGEVSVRDEAGGLVLGFGPAGGRYPLFPWNRDTFSMPLSGDEAAQVAQLGVWFSVGPGGQADSALVSLIGVDPDATATFTRVPGA